MIPAPALSALVEHYQLVVALILLAAIMIGLARSVLQAQERQDKRVARIAISVLQSAEVKEAWREFTAAVVEPLKVELVELGKRDSERKEAVTRAHTRIDDLAARVDAITGDLRKEILELYKKDRT